MKSNYKSVSVSNNFLKKNVLLDIVLIFLITSGLIAYNYLLIMLQIEGTQAFSRSIFPDQFIVAPLTAFIASVVALVKNRRMVLTLSAYLCIGVLFLWLRSIDSSEVLLQTYKLARNTCYFYLLIYIVLHPIIVGIRRFKKPEYQLITPLGLINWWILLMLANFLHAFVMIGR